MTTSVELYDMRDDARRARAARIYHEEVRRRAAAEAELRKEQHEGRRK